MNFFKFIILSMGLATPMANAIVIRHDVPDDNYYAAPSDFPPLATLYNIGVHGTLIHPEWVLTAAHAVFCMNPGQKIKIGDEIVSVANRYSHPDYQLGGEHDIALIKLDSEIKGIEPAELYDGNTEKGAVTWFIGVGGTGTGLKGQTVSYKENNGKLRKAQNKIIGTTDTDLVFKFEKGSKGESLEGVSGNGDSGGPAYIRDGDKYVLLGISSRVDSWFYDVGEYGVTELYTRVTSYRDWIHQVFSANDDSARKSITTQSPFLQDSMKSKNMDELCASLEVQ
ncbi:trypsin-like serine protease [Shewanella sp. FJAT-52076]|uniref:S1 family peptidase n=1 Tax=Shewanella sp. FJAT-52076 TaxID=2864202 RepID=UPI001C6559D0|nr:trypsin-like serine protease [Shewanella sp. FJAT-52076]QYJ76960.1 trypsin-like serine protease [Shewanella sp. FJAT-52076]